MDNEMTTIKNRLLELLKFHIQAEKLKLEVLESLQLQLQNTEDKTEIKKIHDDLAAMLGMKR